MYCNQLAAPNHAVQDNPLPTARTLDTIFVVPTDQDPKVNLADTLGELGSRIPAWRESRYARADALVDTAARTVKQSFSDLKRAVA